MSYAVYAHLCPASGDCQQQTIGVYKSDYSVGSYSVADALIVSLAGCGKSYIGLTPTMKRQERMASRPNTKHGEEGA